MVPAFDGSDPESFWFFGPDTADICMGREASQGLEAACEIICRNEIDNVSSKLIMAIVVPPFDGCLLDRPVHPVELSVIRCVIFGASWFCCFFV